MKKQLIVAVVLAVLIATSASTQTTDFFELVKNGTPQSIQAAIRKGVDVNARKKNDQQTPLMCAAESNQNPEVIAMLLKAGANPNAQDKNAATALMYAAYKNPNPNIITALLEAGADPMAKDNDGWTALMMAAENNQNPDIVTTLLKAGADLDARDRNGMTALMYAAKKNLDLDVNTALLDAGAAVNAKNNQGLTALDETLENPNQYMMYRLRAYGAKGNAYDNYQRSRRDAERPARNVDTRMILRLVSLILAFVAATWRLVNRYYQKRRVTADDGTPMASTAVDNTQDENGRRALIDAAAHTQNPEVITTLLNAGADVKARSDSGKTAFDYALDNDKLKGTDALQQLQRMSRPASPGVSTGETGNLL
jgi:ankyrin repeat protein